MKCHAGVEFESGKPCPKCNAKLGEVCWPGINSDLVELPLVRKENALLRAAILRIDAINDSPACFNSEINAVCDAILRPHLAPSVASDQRGGANG